MNDLLAGPRYLAAGFGLLRAPRLRRFVLMPLLVNLLLFAGLIWWVYGWAEALTLYVGNWLPDWLDWLSYLVLPVFVLVSLLIIFYGFSMVANLIAAPFNGLLAEAVERELTGRPLEGGWRQLLADVLPSIGSELRKLAFFGVRAVPLLLLMLVPVINIAASLLWLMFGAWMMTVQYIDYPMANHRLFFREQRARLRRRPLLAWSFGGLVMLFTMIPVVNFFVMPAAVAGATLMWVREGGLQSPRQ